MPDYVETRRVAHVMQWVETDRSWRPICKRSSLAIFPSKYRGFPDEKWPLRHVWSGVWGKAGEPPSKPWCSYCVYNIRSMVMDLSDCVLAVAEAVDA